MKSVKREEKWYISSFETLFLVGLIAFLYSFPWGDILNQIEDKAGLGRVERLVDEYQKLTPMEQRKFEDRVKEERQRELTRIKEFLHGSN